MPGGDLEVRLESVRVAGRFDAEAVRGFGEWLASAPDEDLFRASPLRYAAATGLPEQAAIDLFLHATRAGILDFAWGVTCPGCAGFLRTAVGLRGLTGTRRCAYCEIEIPGDLDALVEVAFTIAPSVRPLRFHAPDALDTAADAMRIYFSASIADDDPVARPLMDGLVDAVRVPAGGGGRIEADLPPGGYLLCAPALHAFTRLEVLDGEGGGEVAFDLLETGLAPRRASVRAGPVVLEARNTGTRPALLALARDPVPPPERRPKDARPPPRSMHPYLTGKRLIASQTFRDLFRTESIPAESGLELRALTILFTDLKGSTALYGEVGDLEAFDLVRRHFDLLREIVSRTGGGVVKTIGDAVMASFAEPAPALEAAVAMGAAVGTVRYGKEKLLLKIGIHAGPCIAVELNERLDYFGQTVNVAARVQGIAGPAEIVCTRDAFDAPGVADVVRRTGLVSREERVRLKGVEGEVGVVRLAERDAPA